MKFRNIQGKKQKILAQGTLLTLDKATHMAAYVGVQSPMRFHRIFSEFSHIISDKTMGIELNIVEILRRDGTTLNELMDHVRVRVSPIFSLIMKGKSSRCRSDILNGGRSNQDCRGERASTKSKASGFCAIESSLKVRRILTN